jgi:hypothetical protein
VPFLQFQAIGIAHRIPEVENIDGAALFIDRVDDPILCAPADAKEIGAIGPPAPPGYRHACEACTAQLFDFTRQFLTAAQTEFTLGSRHSAWQMVREPISIVLGESILVKVAEMLGQKKPQVEAMLPSWGDHLPGVPDNIPRMLKTFPTYVVRGNALDLDESSLYLADRLIIDEGAFDYITDHSRTYLRPMARSLRRLLDEGRLRKEDYRERAKAFEKTLLSRVNLLIEDGPTYWRPQFIAQFEKQRKVQEEQIEVLGKFSLRKYDEQPYGVITALCKGSGRVSSTEIASLNNLLNSRKNRYSSTELDALREVYRFYITQTLFDGYLSKLLKAPLVAWPAQRPFYDKMSWPLADQPVGKTITQEELDECRRIFAEVIPQLRLASINETVEFLKRPRVRKSLKLSIQRSARGDCFLTPEMIERIKDEIIICYEQLKDKRSGLRIQFLFAKLGIIASGYSILHSLVETYGHWIKESMEIMADLSESAWDGAMERNAQSRYEWYLFFLKMAEQRQRDERAA